MNRINHARSGDWSAFNSYLADLSKQPALSEEEVAAVAQRASEGDVDAQEQLIRSHLRMVVRISHAYAGFGLPLADLISEGNLGLIRAAELYDPKFGTKFATYATVWIKQRIHRAITSQAKAVRIPVWRSQRLRKLARLNDELLAQLGRCPTEEELAERLGVTMDELQDAEADRIQVVSFSATPAHDETGPDLTDMISDERATHPVLHLSKEELIEEIVACLHELDDRELQVVAHKYGLHPEVENGGETKPVSFRELGRRWGISGEWVRRIGELALVKVRRSLENNTGMPENERRRRRAGVLKRIERLSRDPQMAAARA